MKLKPTSTTILIITFLIISICFAVYYSDLISVSLYGDLKNHKSELLKFLMQAIGGILVIWALFYTVRRTIAFEENVKSIRDNIIITERGQNIDRLNNAIEHFSSENINLVLAGIIELKEIAKDEFTEIIIELLRQKLYQLKEDYDIEIVKSNAATFRNEQDAKRVRALEKINRVIFTTLFSNNIFKAYTIDLSYVHFIGLYYENLDLSNTKMENTFITNSKFTNVIFPLEAQEVDNKGSFFIDCILPEVFKGALKEEPIENK